MKTLNLSRRSMLLGGASACLAPQFGQAQERQVEGGIGGTGIVGILTDFGSLIVGGQYVSTDNQTIFADAFGQLLETNLALGDSLTVEASGPIGALVARRVQVTYPLVGPVSEIVGNAARVNGVQVIMPANRPTIAVGDRIAISGLWRGDVVVASRVSRARSSLDLVSGDVGRSLLGNLVGSVAVRSGRLSRQADGSFATVLGRYDESAGRLVAQSVQPNRFVEAAGPLQSLAIEGFLEATPQAPGYRISGLGHSFARNLSLAAHANARTLFTGPYAGTFAADRAVTLPDEQKDRRRILRTLALRG